MGNASRQQIPQDSREGPRTADRLAALATVARDEPVSMALKRPVSNVPSIAARENRN